MELHAYTKPISDLFSAKKKYIVPRFQREYSWEKDQVNSFCEDIFDKINYSNDRIERREYFIGSLVLIGSDNSFEMQIVDGQQRLTTITIFLCCLIEKFKSIGKKNIADAIYNNYIEGTNDDGEKYFKLFNESPKPFFQKNIQFYDKANDSANTDEEILIKQAYDFLLKKLDKDNILRLYKNHQEETNDDESYFKLLCAIRDQITELKVILITVKDEEEAYTIFETLNARGMDLSPVDLIKNELFKTLKKTHPDDFAKTEWNKIKSKLISRKIKVDIDIFFRHFWLSNYAFVQHGKIFSSFKKIQKSPLFEEHKFLEDLNKSADKYTKIVNPQNTDWLNQNELQLYDILLSFSIFEVTQVRPLILSLLDLREKNLITINALIKYLIVLEHFHFCFTAICSSRASGLESSYSKISREIRKLTSRDDILKYLDLELVNFLKNKIPKESIFLEKFNSINYKNDRLLIQYIFRKYETHLRGTNELKIDSISIEHISNQSNNTGNCHLIGNLLPLAIPINNSLNTNSLAMKISEYKKSQLKIVENFVKDNEGKEFWNEDDISKRTHNLAKTFYNDVWRID